ncbi:MAG TPA: lamin tail domain-containing protein, partial [Verrucomicrobiae bacterium]|nr:lamin tail domain-containing protein [Verrucomicrobiae bacterium]
DLWGSAINWRPSGQLDGTPGSPDPGAPVIAPILVNEVLTHTDDPVKDAIELFNPTANDVDIGGWFLSDDFVNPLKYRIPNGTMIPALGYLVFDENDFNPDGTGPLGFSFSSKGDEVVLFSGDPAGASLTGYFHRYDFGAAENGVSFGPHVTSTLSEKFVALESLTLGGANAGPKVGPVVISEIMYHPPDVGGEDDALSEFIELLNISGADVPLHDPANPGNTWQLRKAVDFAFPAGATLAAGGHALVVGFDPGNGAQLAAFRAQYEVPNEVPVYGPYSGKLDNSAEEVELFRPDAPELGEVVPYILVDKVNYQHDAPWPSAADGNGPSLQRIDGNAFGNDPIHWLAAAPTAGQPAAGGELPVITSQPGDLVAVGLTDSMLSVTATGGSSLKYQWRFEGSNIEGATG